MKIHKLWLQPRLYLSSFTIYDNLFTINNCIKEIIIIA